jgi:hypothetical protein
LRSLAPRSVTLRAGERILWRGSIGENLVRIEIPALAVPPGTTPIMFSTDAPGIAESATPGARPLAFALYNLRLD